MNMLSPIAGNVVFLVAGSILSATGQQSTLPTAEAHRVDIVHQRKASLPLPPAPEVVESLPMEIVPLTSGDLPPEPPRVTCRAGVLTVDSQNSTLSDILMAIHQLTGAEFDPMPQVSERVAVHLTGSASDVVSSLLRGSEFGYVIMSDPDDSAVLRKVFLTTTVIGANTKSVLARESTPQLLPPSAIVEPVMPSSKELSTNPEQAFPVATTPSPEESAAFHAQADELQATTQQSVAMPDPVQVVERVNQQNRDQSASPVSAAGQYMQELYRLRLQQQSPNASSTPSTSSAVQQ